MAVEANNRDPGPSLPSKFHNRPNSKMARADISALVEKAVSVIKRGEFSDYSKAAAHYDCDRTSVSKRICGLTWSRKEANSFFHQALTTT